MPIRSNLNALMVQQGLTLTELAERVGITLANLSILKTNKGRAVRFSTLEALCRELNCQPGDLLEFVEENSRPHGIEINRRAEHRSAAGLPGDYY
jgi:putative transcriptional regulator